MLTGELGAKPRGGSDWTKYEGNMAAVSTKPAIPKPEFRRRRVRSDGKKLGQRKQRDWPPLLVATREQRDAIEDWLDEHRPHSPRRRVVTIGVLGMVCQLYAGGFPLPVRRRMAVALKTTVDAIDRAISVALAYGEITEEYRHAEGHLPNQLSITRERYLIPSDELLQVCGRVRRKAA